MTTLPLGINSFSEVMPEHLKDLAQIRRGNRALGRTDACVTERADSIPKHFVEHLS